MSRVLCRRALAGAAVAVCASAAHAQSLRVVTDIWGGSPSGSASGCTTFGPTPAMQGFFGGGGFLAAGGNVACGFTGYSAEQIASAAPLTASQALAPVALDTGGSFSGLTAARAIYGSLGVEAHGMLAGDAINTSATSAAAAALFTDVLSASSGSVADHSRGFVRYLFELDGSLGVPATFTPFHPGFATILFNYQHAAGSIFGSAILQARTAELGYVYTAIGVSDGWTLGAGSVSGSGTFASGLEAIEYGVPWQLQVGMLAQTIGEGAADFLGTGKIVGFEFYDARGSRLSDVDLATASGIDYLHPSVPAVPEPQTWIMTLLGGIVLVASRRRRAMCAGRPTLWRTRPSPG